ncbi:MAG TPA: hypothetical protein VKM72_33370 [Thermoanaerobaculia bacterium]|nr:hypothetical protein [Thermoanaerobaculia bacterium]
MKVIGRESQQPSTVFVPSYLERLREAEETAGGLAAEFEGPWRVEGAGEEWAVLRHWESLEAGHQPLARLRTQEAALLLAALLPALGREVVYRLREGGSGFVLENAGEEVGEVFRFHDRVAESIHLVEHLTRSPRALTYLLRAAGPTAQELVGQMLAEG